MPTQVEGEWEANVGAVAAFTCRHQKDKFMSAFKTALLGGARIDKLRLNQADFGDLSHATALVRGRAIPPASSYLITPTS